MLLFYPFNSVKPKEVQPPFYLRDETLPYEAVFHLCIDTSLICILSYFSFYQLFPEEILLLKLWYPPIMLFLNPAIYYQSQLLVHYRICLKALFRHAHTALQRLLVTWEKKSFQEYFLQK